ncbi:DUF4297 domain-containing protein [Cellulophaga lytica]|uniref:CD-NTase associated protein 4-like DNA endonuclease domain-containing protein n=1 Tax=Cellulophaga lytica (strain ATCC 23178 / DSM 7489 / JCM 8516 / NBRC 14961 / NCIMB 1423 / VKM B-1433 / Cy l20) TaxID=867900 RepID=F0RBC6_CELLC|nr:DUF4297 domain-containing protein [Cellulophaga lytica]ADY29548.1 hypothetical protein Celly_1724 [Cellulophaga lytica DSM 7489]WQG76281.1 DUF4297 domain-containing protein [Cellulophaga lytica]SNQ42701.1 conserved hypothetical protein [Cellulophaga lytica]
MSDKTNQNPLLAVQREKAGSETFEKYSYQYHWALYRVLNDHIKANEYAVFVELHEDVVVSDSLDASKAKFEFNQVKTTKGRFTANKLVHQKKNKKCVLGKLISSGFEKPFKDRITELNLVALNDFSLTLKEEGLSLNKITLNDLSDAQFKELEDEIRKEMGISSLPSNIQFIVPELSEKNFQNDVIASIAKLVSNLFPNSHCSPVEIYRLLIDEINRKGKVTYDFTKWNDLLINKALTSITVTEVINSFTSIKDEAKIEVEFHTICSEIGLNSINSKLLKRPFDRYRAKRISNSSTLQLDTTNFFANEIQLNLDKGIDDLGKLIDNVKKQIPKKIEKQFNNELEIKSAIICEYILL